MSSTAVEGAPLPEADAPKQPEPSQQPEPQPTPTTDPPPTGEEPPKMSKNALKRQRKADEWEAGKDDRRKKRKEKRHERRDRFRTTRDEAIAQGADPADFTKKPKHPTTLVPVSLVLDCDFEKYMSEKEHISLSAQVTRGYSDNRTARFKTHLSVAGWKGKLKERFENQLRNQHVNWKGIEFVPGDFVESCIQAREQMTGEKAGKMIPALQKSLDEKVPWTRDERDPIPMPAPEPPLNDDYKNIVYLTSDSPYSLERLEPNTSYVIGGLVDKNREKGLCYKRAWEKGIRTARLPIGQFMVMQSRQVLATNHVVEIMLKWLEYEDWGKAFEAVIPKRKGGTLRANAVGEEDDDETEEATGDIIRPEEKGEAEKS